MENKSHAMAAGIFVLVVAALLAGLAVWLTRDNREYQLYELSTKDGVSGLHLACTGHYDLIVLDIMLPGMDGYAVCQRLREDARSEVPILMLTARDALEDRLKGLRAGADDYLLKPFALAELVARIEAILRRTDARPAGAAAVSRHPAERNPGVHSPAADLRGRGSPRVEPTFGGLS